MTTLAADKVRAYHHGDIEEYPVIAADIIYEGAAVGENGSGYARPLQAGDPFLGFARVIADNSAGSAGDIRVKVSTRGLVTLAISGLAITANDRPAVYASDDDTFTLTEGANSLVGTVSRWVSTGIGVVEYDAFPNLTITGTFTGATTVAADALAIPVTHRYVAKTTGADAEALTLADGTSGQRLTIELATDGGGDGTLTPTTKTGYAAIVFADAGDVATLEYVDDTVGWIIVGAAGATAQPAITQ